MKINSNIASLSIQRRLADATNAAQQSFTRLSSGLRINKASDDSAGLSVASALDIDSRVYNQGVRNLNDGISALNMADAALAELSNIVIRLSELAEQASSGVLNSAQRKGIDQEAQALSAEYLRIAKSTEFNEQQLLDGTMQELTLQSGYAEQGKITYTLGGTMGTGSFAAGVSYAAETATSGEIALGDINGDGHLDLVSAGQTDADDGLAIVRLGDGSGNFVEAGQYATETLGSREVVLQDLNNDGKLDLITAGRADVNGGWLTVRLGDGTGSFGSALSYAAEPTSSYGIAVGDINGDSVLDIVTSGNDEIGVDGYCTVFIGNGDGSFGTGISYAAEEQISFAVTLGDLNGDGKLDLVTAGRSNGPDGQVTVRLGDGSGSFGAVVSYDMQTNTVFDLSLADLNGDGHLDLVTAGSNDSGAGTAMVCLGDGTGSFGAAVSYEAENTASYSVDLADLNGDGFLDLLTSGITSTPDGYITVRLGDGTGSFGDASSIAAETERTNSVKAADVNEDGVLDLVSTGRSDSLDGYTSVRLAETKGGVSALLPFSLRSQSDALQALPVLQRKLDQLSLIRGGIGASLSRISCALNTSQISANAFLAAKHSIIDADVAQETALLIKNQILTQTAAALLAQANQQPSLALGLLKVT